MRPLPLRALAQPAAVWPAAPWTVATSARSAINPIVRATLAMFILSIPFEIPHRTFLPIEVPTLTGSIFLLATVLQPSACFRRIPAAFLWFMLFMGVLVVSALVNAGDYGPQSAKYCLEIAQVMLISWVMYNLLADEVVVRDVLLSLAAAVAVRAAIQNLGIGATVRPVWTGGDRITVFGQNANLSAIILASGMAVCVGLSLYRVRGVPRLGILWWALAAMMGIAVVQTGSRGGLICTAAGISAFAITGRSRWSKIRNAVLGVLALGVLAWGAFNSDMMRARLLAADEGNLAGREKLYPAFFSMFQEKPILGWGPVNNQFEGARRIADRLHQSRDAHNLVLELITTSGIIGAIPFLIGLALVIRGAWTSRRGALGPIPLAILFAVLVGHMSGTWISAKIVWVAYALALAAGANLAQQHSSHEEPIDVRYRRPI